MAEYAGYVRRETPIDWNSVAGDIVNQLGDVKKEQAAFREKYDKIAAETSAKIGEYEAGQSPQVNDLAYNMIADGRTTLAALHEKLKRREISPDAFNRAAMSMQTQNQEFKNMLSTYNTNVADIEKGIQEGGLSNLSNFQLEQYKDLSDLGNKRFQWSTNPNGITNLYVNTVDEDGNPVRQPMSLSVIRDMGNMRYAKYDLNGELLKSIKSLGIYDIKNIKDARNNPEYENFKNTLVESAVATDNQTASILADYGDYVPYKEGDPAPANGIEMVLQSNGQYEPKITPELKTKAREIINESIEARVGRTETERTPPKQRGDYSDKELKGFRKGYDVTWQAAMGESFEGMSDQYDFQIVEDGINVFKLSDSGTRGRKVNDKPLPLGKAKTAEYLSKYTKEFGSSGQQGKWDAIHQRQNRQDVDLVTVGEDVEVKPYSPSAQETTLLLTADDSIFNTVNRDDDEDSVLESKAKIEEFIKLKAPKSNVSFRTSSQKIGKKGDRYKETVILINGSPVRDEDNQLLKIQHDKQGFTKEDFLNIITKAVNEAQKKKRFIAQAPGQAPTGVSPNNNVAINLNASQRNQP